MDRQMQCAERAIEHAVALRERVNAGELNASAVEGLMVTYLDQPAFEPEQRADLLQRALQYIGYRRFEPETCPWCDSPDHDIGHHAGELSVELKRRK